MSGLLEDLIQCSHALRMACEAVGESGYVTPSFHVVNLPRELFDEIPSISRIDDSDPNDPIWQKRYKGVLWTCWEAPRVML